MKLQQEVTQDILNENKDFLMDAMDREMLIEKIFTRVRNINGNILYIILRLENAKKIPYLYQVPVLEITSISTSHCRRYYHKIQIHL
jgi:hypothetical protein